MSSPPISVNDINKPFPFHSLSSNDSKNLIINGHPPLRVIIHIDMDCYYAQVARERYGWRYYPVSVIQNAVLCVTTNYSIRMRAVGKMAHPNSLNILLPESHYMGNDMPLFRRYARHWSDIMQRVIARYEEQLKIPAIIQRKSIDEAFLDVSHLSSFMAALWMVRNQWILRWVRLHCVRPQRLSNAGRSHPSSIVFSPRGVQTSADSTNLKTNKQPAHERKGAALNDDTSQEWTSFLHMVLGESLPSDPDGDTMDETRGSHLSQLVQRFTQGIPLLVPISTPTPTNQNFTAIPPDMEHNDENSSPQHPGTTNSPSKGSTRCEKLTHTMHAHTQYGEPNPSCIRTSPPLQHVPLYDLRQSVLASPQSPVVHTLREKINAVVSHLQTRFHLDLQSLPGVSELEATSPNPQRPMEVKTAFQYDPSELLMARPPAHMAFYHQLHIPSSAELQIRRKYNTLLSSMISDTTTAVVSEQHPPALGTPRAPHLQINSKTQVTPTPIDEGRVTRNDGNSTSTICSAQRSELDKVNVTLERMYNSPPEAPPHDTFLPLSLYYRQLANFVTTMSSPDESMMRYGSMLSAQLKSWKSDPGAVSEQQKRHEPLVKGAGRANAGNSTTTLVPWFVNKVTEQMELGEDGLMSWAQLRTLGLSPENIYRYHLYQQIDPILVLSRKASAASGAVGIQPADTPPTQSKTSSASSCGDPQRKNSHASHHFSTEDIQRMQSTLGLDPTLEELKLRVISEIETQHHPLDYCRSHQPQFREHSATLATQSSRGNDGKHSQYPRMTGPLHPVTWDMSQLWLTFKETVLLCEGEQPFNDPGAPRTALTNPHQLTASATDEDTFLSSIVIPPAPLTSLFVGNFQLLANPSDTHPPSTMNKLFAAYSDHLATTPHANLLEQLVQGLMLGTAAPGEHFETSHAPGVPLQADASIQLPVLSPDHMKSILTQSLQTDAPRHQPRQQSCGTEAACPTDQSHCQHGPATEPPASIAGRDACLWCLLLALICSDCFRFVLPPDHLLVFNAALSHAAANGGQGGSAEQPPQPFLMSLIQSDIVCNCSSPAIGELHHLHIVSAPSAGASPCGGWHMRWDPARLSMHPRDAYHTMMHACASQIAYEVRSNLFTSLGFTTSCGISANPMLSKMISSSFKPNQQSLVLPMHATQWIRNKRLSEVPGIGPKSVEIIEALGLTTIASVGQHVTTFPEFLQQYGGTMLTPQSESGTPATITQEFAQRLWSIYHGVDLTAVEPTKRPHVVGQSKNRKTTTQKQRQELLLWLSEQLYTRIEEDIDEFNRIPTKLVLHLSFRFPAKEPRPGHRPYTYSSVSRRTDLNLRYLTLNQQQQMQFSSADVDDMRETNIQRIYKTGLPLLLANTKEGDDVWNMGISGVKFVSLSSNNLAQLALFQGSSNQTLDINTGVDDVNHVTSRKKPSQYFTPIPHLEKGRGDGTGEHSDQTDLDSDASGDQSWLPPRDKDRNALSSSAASNMASRRRVAQRGPSARKHSAPHILDLLSSSSDLASDDDSDQQNNIMSGNHQSLLSSSDSETSSHPIKRQRYSMGSPQMAASETILGSQVPYASTPSTTRLQHLDELENPFLQDSNIGIAVVEEPPQIAQENIPSTSLTTQQLSVHHQLISQLVNDPSASLF